MVVREPELVRNVEFMKSITGVEQAQNQLVCTCTDRCILYSSWMSST